MTHVQSTLPSNTQGQLDLSLLPTDYTAESETVVCGRIRKFTTDKQFLLVDLARRQHGRVHVTDLADKYIKGKDHGWVDVKQCSGGFLLADKNIKGK